MTLEPGPTSSGCPAILVMNFALASPWFSPIAPEKYTGLMILDVMDPETQFTVPCGSLAATPEHVEDTAAAGMRLI